MAPSTIILLLYTAVISNAVEIEAKMSRWKRNDVGTAENNITTQAVSLPALATLNHNVATSYPALAISYADQATKYPTLKAITPLNPERRVYEKKPEITLDLLERNYQYRETSSSSGEVQRDPKKADEDSEEKESLMLMSSEMASKDISVSVKKAAYTKKNKWVKSSKETHGWQKYHRKCAKCPEEMRMKWRDPRIKWICGAYQRARRTFKSKCMMVYRNCQDGTMFTMLHTGKCKEDSPDDSKPHGEHFFYQYKVQMSDDSTQTESTSEDTESDPEDIF